MAGGNPSWAVVLVVMSSVVVKLELYSVVDVLCSMVLCEVVRVELRGVVVASSVDSVIDWISLVVLGTITSEVVTGFSDARLVVRSSLEVLGVVLSVVRSAEVLDVVISGASVLDVGGIPSLVVLKLVISDVKRPVLSRVVVDEDSASVVIGMTGALTGRSALVVVGASSDVVGSDTVLETSDVGVVVDIEVSTTLIDSRLVVGTSEVVVTSVVRV